MSIRRLNEMQLINLYHRVIHKTGIMLRRACPANHWNFRRIPLIHSYERVFRVYTPHKNFVVTFSEFRRLSVFNVYKHLCRSFWSNIYYYSIRISSASLINKSEILL